jgi:DNA polymerase (family 10)
MDSNDVGRRKGAETIALLHEISQLMGLNEENPFKIRSFERAADALVGVTDLEEKVKDGSLRQIRGVGESIAAVIEEFVTQGRSSLLEGLLAALPPGLLELMRVPGIGSKKAGQLVRELGISSLQELEAACRDGRVAGLKGFGDKVQARIMSGIGTLKAAEGKLRIDHAEEYALMLLPILREAVNSDRHPAASPLRVEVTGELRRMMEVVSSIEFLVELPLGERAAQAAREKADSALASFIADSRPKIRHVLHFAPENFFGYELARTTGSREHWEALGSPERFDCREEKEFYVHLGLPCLPPEIRETGRELKIAKLGGLAELMPWSGLTGSLHNHSSWSDGRSTLEDMIAAAKRAGHKYIGITDHSQTSGYAGGLKPERLVEQLRELRELQKRHSDIRILCGTESDILKDGSLDFDPELLKQLDFVVASVHSSFSMTKEEMTVRLIKAVKNPFTRILGHPSGRWLLERPAYQVDLDAVIREAVREGVGVEINANPLRLDLDWHWGPLVRETGCLIAINADSHDVFGFDHLKYGVAMARKALIPSTQVVNSWPVEKVMEWIGKRRW